MARDIKVRENETHWQSRDIGKLVRLCLKAAGEDTDHPIRIRVFYSKTAQWEFLFDEGYKVRHLSLHLPKRGSRSGQTPITQLAEAALGADGDILPLHQTYELSKALAWDILTRGGCKARGLQQRTDRIRKVRRGARPFWVPEEFSIRKYAPKKRPEDNRTFIEKVKDDIIRAEERVEKWEAEVEHAEAHLKRAQRDLKKHKKRLRDAKKRREQ